MSPFLVACFGAMSRGQVAYLRDRLHPKPLLVIMRASNGRLGLGIQGFLALPEQNSSLDLEARKEGQA